MKTSNLTPTDSDYDNDSDVDIAFGVWLEELRLRRELSLYDVHNQTSIPISRIRNLELGEALRGITQDEAKKIASLYEVSVKELIDKAITG